MALQAGALGQAIKAIVTISATDIGTSRLQVVPTGKRDLATKGVAAGLAAEGMAPLRPRFRPPRAGPTWQARLPPAWPARCRICLRPKASREECGRPVLLPSSA
jgi:hypothetical protein